MNSFSSFLSFCKLKGVDIESTVLLYNGPHTYEKVDLDPEAYYELIMYTVHSSSEVAEVIVRMEMYNKKTHFSIINIDIFFEGFPTRTKSNLFKRNAKLSDLIDMVS